MRYLFCIIIIFGSILVAPANSWAQNITVINNLTLGNMLPGVPKVISKRSAGAAAEFHISGIAGDEMSIDFSLPTYMNSGTSNMQMVFTTTDCAMDSSSSPDQSEPGNDDLNPWHSITYRLGANGLTIWLGGMTIPKINQRPGNYSAVIVLTVTPTGL